MYLIQKFRNSEIQKLELSYLFFVHFNENIGDDRSSSRNKQLPCLDGEMFFIALFQRYIFWRFLTLEPILSHIVTEKFTINIYNDAHGWIRHMTRIKILKKSKGVKLLKNFYTKNVGEIRNSKRWRSIFGRFSRYIKRISHISKLH